MWPSVVVQIWHMRKDSGAQKRLICAPIAIFVQLVRKKGGFAHGFHSRPVKVSGFFAVAPPEQVRCREFTLYRQSVRKTPGKSVPIQIAGSSVRK